MEGSSIGVDIGGQIGHTHSITVVRPTVAIVTVMDDGVIAPVDVKGATLGLKAMVLAATIEPAAVLDFDIWRDAELVAEDWYLSAAS